MQELLLHMWGNPRVNAVAYDIIERTPFHYFVLKVSTSKLNVSNSSRGRDLPPLSDVPLRDIDPYTPTPWKQFGNMEKVCSSSTTYFQDRRPLRRGNLHAVEPPDRRESVRVS
jgi:hypothetical protein